MNKTIIVTGATRGIGKAIVSLLAKDYFVVGLYKSTTQNAAKLESEYSNVKMYQCDISDCDSVLQVKDIILKDFGNVYGIVNNAGVARTKLFTDCTEEDYNFIMNTNVKGMFNVTKTFLPSLIHNKCGKIVNVSSMWGVTGGSCEVLYSASKAAVIGLTKSLAKEVGLSGIQVNCVAPGVIETDMINNLSLEDKKAIAEESALGRNGTPTDVAKAVSFLLSENSDFITGQVLNIDGGMVI